MSTSKDEGPASMASLFSNGKNSIAKVKRKSETLSTEDELMLVDDDGDVEPAIELGKRFLLDMRPECTQKYLDVVKEQLLQGEGETMVELGVAIDCVQKEAGLDEKEIQLAEENHNKLLEHIDCVGTPLLERVNNDGHTKVVLVRRSIEETDFIEIRIAVVGNVDAGKSTLLGVLTHNILDDGRGHARKKLFRHKHEFESGRTSSVGNDILGFDIHGQVMNSPDAHSGHLDWVSICRDSAKVVTFIDLAGHEKYLKTTIFGMTGHMPDYTMLMIGANAGVIGTTREHLSLALSLSVPVFIVVTKVDMCPPQILEETLHNLDKLMKSPGARKRPIQVSTMEDVVQAAHNFSSGKVCPIFQVSNVKGTNLELLRSFLNIVPVARVSHESEPAEFQIDDIYWVEGIGTVVSGTCLAGRISLNDNLMLGPDTIGAFTSVPIKSIHRKRMPVASIRSGQTASFALRKTAKKDVRKGMVLVSAALNPSACYEFDAEVLILHHPTTIAPNYQAMIHAGSIRQTATIQKIMTKEVLRTGDRDLIRMRFMRHPEYLRSGTRMVFREGRTKAVGTIRSIYPHIPVAQAAQSEKKGHGRQVPGSGKGGKTQTPRPARTIMKRTAPS